MTARHVPSVTDNAPREAFPPDAPRPHVLIVDDQQASRALCANYCDLFDHTSETARSRDEAVEALARRRFDVVVMNVHMDADDGFDTVLAVRDHPAAAPVIGMAAPGRAEEAQRWLAAGLAGVVAKPVTASRLYAAINSVLTPVPDTPRSWAPAG